MKRNKKIILSIPSIIGIVFLIVLLIPKLKNWTNKNLTDISLSLLSEWLLFKRFYWQSEYGLLKVLNGIKKEKIFFIYSA